MSGGTSPAERLQRYLREISPEARALLLRELDRGALAGEQFPGLELILDELRAEQRAAGQTHERLDAPDRRFFLPIEPFLVDEEIPERIAGRIARAPCREFGPGSSATSCPRKRRLSSARR